MLLFFYRLLMGLCLMPAVCAAQALPAETAYLYDPTRLLQIEDMPAQSMNRYQGNLQLGLREGSGWIRITTQVVDSAAGGADLPPVLRIGPLTLDRVDVYEWVEGKWAYQVRGDTQSRLSQSICPDDYHCLMLHQPASKPQTVYVRVQNHGLLVVKVEVLAPQDVAAAVAQRVTSLTASLAVAVGFLLIGIAWFVYARSRLMLVYCGFQLTVILVFAASNGMLFTWVTQLAPDTANLIGDTLIVARVAMIILLGWKFMVAFQPRKGYRRGMQLLLVLCLVNLILVMAGRAHLGLVLNTIVLGINPLIQLWGAITCPNLGVIRQRFLLLTYVVYSVVFTNAAWGAFGSFSSSLQMMRFVQYHEIGLNGASVGLVFFIFVVYEQIQRQREEKMRVNNLCDQAQQGKYANERLTERRTLIEMLTHELKTPLGTLSFALASLRRDVTPNEAIFQRILHIEDAISRMDALIGHVTKANQIDFIDEVKNTVRVDARAFLEDIAAEYANAERFVFDIEPQAWFKADLQLLTVMLENLMRNAYLYGIADKPIHIRVTMSATQTEFEISNPVAHDRTPDAQRVFERYYRHANVRDQPGMGIGLSLVQSSAEKMKATVSYQQRAMNAVFTLKLNT